MNWIGLRDVQGGQLNPYGLDKPAPEKKVSGDLVMATGSLMMECALMPNLGQQTLLRYVTQSPRSAGLCLTLDPDGTFTLSQWLGNRKRDFRLRTGLEASAEAITVIFTWDAKAQQAVLSVEDADNAVHAFARYPQPLPLTMRDAARLMGDRARTSVTPGARFLAISDDIMPIGPLPSLDPLTPIATPGGMQSVSALQAGNLVTLEDGSTAQVRWSGGIMLPARGRFTPLTLRAPFYGATRDLKCAADQRLQIRSSEVEYLFATDAVAVRIGDLTEGVSISKSQAPLVGYWQILLDHPVPLRVGGLDLEALDPSPMIENLVLRRHGVFRDMPPEMMPLAGKAPAQMLRPFETRTLCHLRAA